jgi:hypothetical protein
MTVTVVDSGSATGTATLTYALPAGTQVDDLVLVGQLTVGGGALQTNPSSAGTWTTIGSTNTTSNTSAFRIWRRSVTTAGTQSITMGGSYGGTFGHSMVVLLIRGHDLTTPIDAFTFSIGAAVSSYVMTGVTTTTASCLLLGMYGGRSSTATASTYTPPGSMTELQDLAGSSRFQIGAASEALSAAGATGTRTVTTTTTYNTSGALLAIRPAVAAVVSDRFLQFF